jgi:hypothetical protein
MAVKVYSRLFSDGGNCEALPFSREISMGDYIWCNPTLLKMKDLTPVFRSRELPCEKTDKSLGRIDALVVYDDYPAIVELKNDELNPCHSKQLLDYLTGKFSTEVLQERKPCGILVGLSIGRELWVDLIREPAKYKNIAIFTLNRYKTEDKTFDIVNVVNELSFRDYKKYVVKGDPVAYPKSRLLFVCVSMYLMNMRKAGKPVSFASLEEKVEVQRETRFNRHPYLLNVEKLKYHKYEWAYYKSEVLTSDDGVSFVVFNWFDKSDIPDIKKVAINLSLEVIEAKK